MTEKNGKIQKLDLKSRINVRTYTMIAALIVLWILFTSLTGGAFIMTRNISNLVRQMAIVGILGTGMVMVIVTGGIDLSVGSVLGFTGGVASALMAWYNWQTATAIFVALFIGLIIGLIQGSIIAYSGVPAFIVSLGGMLIFRGGILGVTRGTTIAPLKKAYLVIGQSYINKTVGLILAIIMIALLLYSTIKKRQSRIKYNFSVETMSFTIIKWITTSALIIIFTLIMNDYRGIPVPVLLMLALVVIFTFIAEKTTFGRSIYAIGGNIEAAKYSGINVSRNILIVYALNGLMAAIAGIVLSARLNAGVPSSGQNMELDAIAAAVIGGTSMSGGSGKVAGAILGALFMATIDNGMSLMNMEAYWQYIVKGLILVAAVWFDIRTKKSAK
ncbi:MAG: sugar ABC transporter permease [Acetivibrionales bacterium]|jgi:D-xylose transport system permease protein